ncbi:hypothetical protein [Bradyrhizobium sp. dw_411]|uniref:hypothetical protein n=1 Tax=Bradyrhizobium sp. dw_411 TaxID=2720082 RepID=UPI001BCFE203|nr:hypothetical protein [Bradyrhizobium sp. dw_411]
MQNAADHASVRPGDLNDNYTPILSNLRSLLEQVNAAMKLIEAAIANEAATSHPDMATNVVVLDDVTPRYVRANAALSTCNAGLGVALHLVRDISSARQKAPRPNAGGLRDALRPRTLPGKLR